MLNLGGKITEQPKQMRWSQTEFPKAIYASEDIVGNCVRNKNTQSIEMALKIAYGFRITIDYFFRRMCFHKIQALPM